MSAINCQSESIAVTNDMTMDFTKCCICFSKDIKFRVHRAVLAHAYRRIIGADVVATDFPCNLICSICAHQLLRFDHFKNQCVRAKEFLESRNVQSEEPPYSTYLQLSISKTYITSSFDDIPDTTDLKIEPPDTFESNGNSQPSSPTENLKIYTDEIKIEKGEKKKGFFESKESLKEFERQYDVAISVLSKDEQFEDVMSRKLSGNYLNSPYKCDMCYKGFMSEELLKKHVLSQHDASRGDVVCEFCRFRYKDRRGLNQHLKSHRLKFSCKQCSYVSRTTFNAKEHFKMHGGQLHECRHCGKSYEKLSSHLTHLRIQHPSEFIWCDVCGEAFIGDFGLNAHKKRAHRHLSLPAKCSSCDKCFLDQSALKRHSLTNSCSEQSCVLCGEAFEQALDLRDHLLEKHRSCKVYDCEKCDKTFSRQSLYSAHYRRIHVTSEERARRHDTPWVCEVCGKTLPNKCMLLYHQRNHTGERPYACSHCNKRFTMKKLLQSHLRVHSSDRPYSCKLCPKTFKGLSALRAHEKVHTGGQDKIPRNITI
ncbi:unnamed protein product [Chrysodeixis includens]|uniref:C2H2-type domain-containing protein n=1 Tax=Chrysodeixis includens TaxID=689277 RepID=A0A9P0FUZ4_CHRIL|nr:unnamed protein product [Chrysodeixis includens]